MIRTTAVLTVVCAMFVLAFSGGTKTASATDPQPFLHSWVLKHIKATDQPTCNKFKIVKGIRFYRASTWMWQWQEGVPFSRFSKWRPRHSCEYLSYLAERARDKARDAHHSYNTWYQVTYDRWSCIHGYEGAWNDPDAPYYGGLQMDLSFQKAHGRAFLKLWGTADHWPIWAQLRAAEDARVRAGRGYYPWPNTARYCGLL